MLHGIGSKQLFALHTYRPSLLHPRCAPLQDLITIPDGLMDTRVEWVLDHFIQEIPRVIYRQVLWCCVLPCSSLTVSSLGRCC